MPYIFIALIIVVIGFSLYKMLKKKSLPSNQYTPYDNNTLGKKIDVKHIEQLQDTKHTIEYEEKQGN